MKERLCQECGHSISDHDGLGDCQATIEQGKAFFECTCSMFVDDASEEEYQNHLKNQRNKLNRQISAMRKTSLKKDVLKNCWNCGKEYEIGKGYSETQCSRKCYEETMYNSTLKKVALNN